MRFADLVALHIHDIKNRLAMVAARAERRGDTETMRDMLAVTGELSRLLACYKAEAGQLQPLIDAHAPDYLVQELVADYQHLLTPRVETQTERAPPSWYYDESLVRMVLANALQNGLRSARSRVRVSVAEDGDWLEFCIHDDGAGYPEERLNCVDEAAPISQDGIGVGLYLAHKVAGLHVNNGLRGEVRLQNEDGAVFRLRLPA